MDAAGGRGSPAPIAVRRPATLSLQPVVIPRSGVARALNSSTNAGVMPQHHLSLMKWSMASYPHCVALGMHSCKSARVSKRPSWIVSHLARGQRLPPMPPSAAARVLQLDQLQYGGELIFDPNGIPQKRGLYADYSEEARDREIISSARPVVRVGARMKKSAGRIAAIAPLALINAA